MRYIESNKRVDIITKLIGLCSIVLFFLIILAKCFYLFNILSFPIAVVGSIVLLLCSIIVFKYNHVVSEKTSIVLSKLSSINYTKMLVIVIGLSLITKIIAIIVLQINSIDHHPDINVYVTTSQDLVESGYAQHYADYCFSFSHMYWFAVFLTPVTALFGVSQIAYSIYLTIGLTVVAGLLFDLITYVSTKEYAFLILLLFLLMPSQILLPQYITHEIASLLFLSLFLWLYFKKYPQSKSTWKKVTVLGLSLIALFLCSALNSLGLVAIIAAIIIFIVEIIRKRDKKTILHSAIKCGSLILVFVIGTFLLGSFQQNHSQLNPNKVPTNKVLWTLNVGSNYESGGGWFSDEKWEKYPESYDSKEIDDYHKDLIYSHYQDLLNPPTKLINHLKNKLVTIWGDFSYSIGFSNETITNDSVRQVYNRYLFKPLSLLNYIVMFAIAVLGLTGLIKARKKNKPLVLVFCELYVLGTTALLLITECSNKYTISMVPVFLIISLLEHNVFDSKE